MRPGPAPKMERIRERDTNRRLSEFTVLHADGVAYGPELPAGIIDWPQQTLDFWETLRTDAAASTWSPLDWRYLQDVALLHADLWSGNPKVAAEIRLRLSQFGVTPDARQRMRLLISDTPPPDAQESTLDSLRQRQEQQQRRRRLTRIVNDN